MKIRCWISLCVLAEGVHGQLVGRHHDGGVGDLPDQLGAQAPVEAVPALLPVDQPECLPE